MEVRIFLKIYSICTIQLNEDINVKHFYDITNKIYLWKTLNKMEKRNYLKSYKEGIHKYIYLTSHGMKLCELIKELNKK
jgi:hypothetical protein